MSRKDTIIIAVLVNAGLLIVLFASALKSNISGQESVAHVVSQPQGIEEPLSKKESAHTGGDEVDRALQHYAQAPSIPTQAPSTPPAVARSLQAAPVESASPAQSSFTEDLKLFNLPEASRTPLARSPLKTKEIEETESVAEFIEVKVKKGDMLEKLARHHQTTVPEIMALNQLTNTNLKIGQILKIANKAAKGKQIISQSPSHVTVPAAELRAEESTPTYYTVQKGDNPWTIAVKNHMKVAELLKLNNMSEDQARRLKPGDQLRIR